MLDVTFFLPGGCRAVREIDQVKAEDAEWFRINQVDLSMEDRGAAYVIWADTKHRVGDDPREDPDEITHVCTVNARCIDELTAVRRKCEERLMSSRPRFLQTDRTHTK
jgi:hypothetical protein